VRAEVQRRLPKEWSEEEIAQLTELWTQLKDDDGNFKNLFSPFFRVPPLIFLSFSLALDMRDLIPPPSFFFSFLLPPFFLSSSMRNQVGRLSSAFIRFAFASVTVVALNTLALKSLWKLIAILIPREEG